jgi:hypothetical protein
MNSPVEPFSLCENCGAQVYEAYCTICGRRLSDTNRITDKTNLPMDAEDTEPTDEVSSMIDVLADERNWPEEIVISREGIFYPSFTVNEMSCFCYHHQNPVTTPGEVKYLLHQCNKLLNTDSHHSVNNPAENKTEHLFIVLIPSESDRKLIQKIMENCNSIDFKIAVICLNVSRDIEIIYENLKISSCELPSSDEKESEKNEYPPQSFNDYLQFFKYILSCSGDDGCHSQSR